MEWRQTAARGARAAGEGTRQVYGVAHNVAKRETHEGRELLESTVKSGQAGPAGSDLRGRALS